MKLNSQRSKLEGWSIRSERARQLVSKAVEVIATGEVYDKPPQSYQRASTYYYNNSQCLQAELRFVATGGRVKFVPAV